MNKLRLIKIYELKGKVHPIEQYVIDLLDGIEIILTENYIEYNKEGREYFTYNLNNNDIWVYSILYNYFKFNFGCYYNETKEIMKYLLEKHLNLKINRVR